MIVGSIQRVVNAIDGQQHYADDKEGHGAIMNRCVSKEDIITSVNAFYKCF